MGTEFCVASGVQRGEPPRNSPPHVFRRPDAGRLWPRTARFGFLSARYISVENRALVASMVIFHSSGYRCFAVCHSE